MGESWNPETLRGTRIGSCILEAPLGVGGMGAVYLARQERPRRQVAVKVLRPQLTENAREWRVFLTRFRREADATAALDHANIVPIYESGEEGSLAYLVMPYLANGSLADLLAREGTLPLARTIPYIEQVAAALDYAHAHGIVHRDVKPSNVLLHPDGRALLADFGIARSMRQLDLPVRREKLIPSGAGAAASYDGALTIAGATMGTPEYMAPEQVRGEPVTGKADLYALGILTYVMLTGTSPFAGGDITTVLTRQLVDPPLPVRTLHPEIPKRVEEVIFWALAKSPDERPASAGAFAQALHAASRGRTLGSIMARAAAVAPSGAATAGAASTAFVPSSHAPILLPPGSATGANSINGINNAVHGPGSMGDADAGHTTDGATIYDGPGRWAQRMAGTGQGASGLTGGPMPPVPQWPGGPEREEPPKPIPWGRLGALAAAAVVCIVVLALLVNMLAQGSLGNANAGGPGNPAAHTGTPTPTITPQPTVTPFPTNWLTASPASVSLGCKGGKKSATIRLRNSGPNDLDWSVNTDGAQGISVSPPSGTVDSGGSTSVTITNSSLFLGHQGEVMFTPDNENAGAPAMVSYQTQPCFTGG